MIVPIEVYLFLLAELVVVSVLDIRQRVIKNYWPILNISLFVAFIFVYPNFYFFKWDTFVFSLTFLAVGFFLFLLKIMGAGDTKFLFSFFLLIPLSAQEGLFQLLLYSTVLIGCFFFFTNFIRHFEKIVQALKTKNYLLLKDCFGSKFPFAPVILLSWLWLGWKEKILF